MEIHVLSAPAVDEKTVIRHLIFLLPQFTSKKILLHKLFNFAQAIVENPGDLFEL